MSEQPKASPQCGSRGDYHKKYDTLDEVFRVLECEAKAFSPETAVSIKELSALMERCGNLSKPPAPRTLSELLFRVYHDNLPGMGHEWQGRQFPWRLECVLRSTSAGVVSYEPLCAWEDRNPDARLNQPGYFYLHNILSPSEWKMFADMVQVYPYISVEDSKKFLYTLNRMSHLPVPNLADRYAFRRNGTLDFSLLEKLDDALYRKRWVRITYGEYRLRSEGGRLKPVLVPRAHNPIELGPYALIWSNGYYYLVGAHQQLGTLNLRVDRMLAVEVLDQPVKRPISFDPTVYRDSSPVMYAGTPSNLVLRCRESLLNVVLDFFGPSVRFFDQRDGRFSVSLHVPHEGAKLFIRQYIHDVEVVSPPELRREMLDELRQAVARMEGEDLSAPQ